MKRNFQKYTLFVKNYPNNFIADSFEQIFGPYGGIQGVQLKKDYALITFETTAQAVQAQKHLNNETINGKAMQVKFYEPKEVKQ